MALTANFWIHDFGLSAIQNPKFDIAELRDDHNLIKFLPLLI